MANTKLIKEIIPYEKSFATHPMAKRWSNENCITPEYISRNSYKRCRFICDNCNHVYVYALSSFADDDDDNKHCSYCLNRSICKDKFCDTCFKKSFAYLEISCEWDYDNNKIGPMDIFPKCNMKANFICSNPKCGHKYQMAVWHSTMGMRCQYCCYPPQKLCDDNDCVQCFNNSFAAHEKSYLYSPKNTLPARKVFRMSNKKYIMLCDICDHEWITRPSHLTNCPYCKNKKLCDNKDCEFCFNKSFASIEESKYLVNTEIARTKFMYSHDRVDFLCPNCEEIYNTKILYVTNGCWCACTTNKTEKKLFKFLKEKLDVEIIKGKFFQWCKLKRMLPFDFFIQIYKSTIELDGDQHFKNYPNRVNYKETQKRDIYKMKCANEQGLSVIRIYQPDVLYNKNNWQVKLLQAILIAKYSPKPINILIGKKYLSHKVYEVNDYLYWI